MDKKSHDGLGTACLVCDEYCKGRGLRWKGASWEIDSNLVKLIAKHFPDVVARGDFEKESAMSLRDLVQVLDPGGNKSIVVVAAGPPCHDFSRIRSDAPGHNLTTDRKAPSSRASLNLPSTWRRFGNAAEQSSSWRTSFPRTAPTCARSRSCSTLPPST